MVVQAVTVAGEKRLLISRAVPRFCMKLQEDAAFMSHHPDWVGLFGDSSAFEIIMLLQVTPHPDFLM